MQVRQGDVLLSSISRIPRGASVRTMDRLVVAEGEVTGHCHEVVAGATCTSDMPPAQLFEAPDGQRYLLVMGAAVNLVHPEHGPITLDPGAYQITYQREYTPEEIRRVED